MTVIFYSDNRMDSIFPFIPDLASSSGTVFESFTGSGSKNWSKSHTCTVDRTCAIVYADLDDANSSYHPIVMTVQVGSSVSSSTYTNSRGVLTVSMPNSKTFNVTHTSTGTPSTWYIIIAF